jgi:hypothetical protein
MRDYRGAKAMAQALRRDLKAQSLDITHSNALELIAKAFGFKNWQVLAARIEADLATKKLVQPRSSSVLYCSFCGKAQHEVSKLIAGRDASICDECVGLCDDLVTGHDPVSFINSQEALSAKSAEELVALRSKAAARIAHARRLLEVTDTTGPEGPHEQSAYAATISQRLTGLEQVSETVASLLVERAGAAAAPEA